MRKPRKMLGDVNGAACAEMMELMPSRSAAALAVWAIDYANGECFEIAQRHTTQNDQELNDSLGETVRLCRAYSAGLMTPSRATVRRPELTLPLKTASRFVSAETDPIAAAAARAISIACAAVRTPTSSLGFLFYLAAAKAYDQLGLNAGAAEYGAFAEKELQSALKSLRENTKPDLLNPSGIEWNC